MNKTRYYIGIDPGKKTGWAVWDSKKQKYLAVKTIRFWDAVLIIRDLLEGSYSVVVEKPARFLYRRNYNTSRRVEANIAHKAGGTYREAELLIEYCELNGIPVEAKEPTRYSGSKMDAKRFKRITGYEGRTSEHARDAAMLVFGR